MAVRWFLGLALVFVCGWGLAIFTFFTAHRYKVDAQLATGVIYVLTFGLLYALETNMWLSRFMGLRVTPASRPWKSALFLWLTGVVGLLLRSTVAEPSLAAEARPGSRTQTDTPANLDGTREIIETVVFVVVLVLMLKSFVAEAFVIPTGSMAETLWGYQKVVKCPKCDYVFPVNCSQEVDPQDGRDPTPTTHCQCPNCLQRIELIYPPYEPNPVLSEQIKNPGWNSGDRVLVAKFLYELFDMHPNRLDVVVFKYPGESENGMLWPRTGPQKFHVPINYIKRLIGLPGETIIIWRGKLYRIPPDKSQHRDFKPENGESEEEFQKRLWQYRFMDVKQLTQGEPKAQELLHLAQIIRKPPQVMLAMMRLVYDNDFPARDLKNRPRWNPEPNRGWSPDNEHGFRFDGGSDMAYVRYFHLLRDNGGKRALIQDFMGYNSDGASNALNWASDLILECEAVVDRAEGELELELSKGVDRFRARWDLASGVCTLYRVTDGREHKLESRPTSMKKKGSYRLRFADVDEKLTVWVDNELPFGDDGVVYEPPTNRGPTVVNDLEPASVGARGAAVSVRKLRLFRDTYYTAGSNPSSADARVENWTATEEEIRTRTNPSSWAPLEDGQMPVKALYVQPGHYLCMGDNSSHSSDGRSWGLVPQRLLLGRALATYYPFPPFGQPRAGLIR
jgi:signal peptidase I